MPKPNRIRRGFTLIELLIIITIIGILATLIVASFTTALQKARDSKRKTDLYTVKKALFLANRDCDDGLYYPAGGGANLDRSHYTSMVQYLFDVGYIKTKPLDPRDNHTFDDPTDSTYYYKYLDGTPISFHFNHCAPDPIVDPGTQYKSVEDGYWVLVAQLERVNDSQANESMNKCASAIENQEGDGLSYPEDLNKGFYVLCSDR